jgi:NAD(P)-dependent dehydrogenase (short-subunit alcohol dehydrogenase family)
MAGRLAGKVAVITGGCSGIGRGAVELFVREGARVVIADILDERGRELEQQLGGAVAYARCDVLKEDEIAAALARAQSAFGGLDILFNNAGSSDQTETVETIEADRWDWVFALLVRGPALAVKHATPMMEARGGGSIVNTASVAGLQGGMGPLGYSCAKAALLQFTRVTAAQLAGRRIRINAICPGLIATPIFGAATGMPLDAAEQLAAKIAEVAPQVQPIPKAGMPEDIAEAALYLASDASRFVTGTHLVVDGGITLGGRSGGSPLRALMERAAG